VQKKKQKSPLYHVKNNRVAANKPVSLSQNSTP